MSSASEFAETADIETSSDGYANRFSGAIGAWFLKIQEEATLRMLLPHAGATVLDVGGGHGQLTGALIRNGYRVTVLGSADVCQARIKPFIDAGHCTFRVGNILALPYHDRAFDVVISYRLLPHVTRWHKLLHELTRVAQKAILIDYPTTRSFNRFAPHFLGFKTKLEGNTRPFTCFKDTELLAAFQNLGFTCVDRYPELFFPMILHRMLRCPTLSACAESVCRASKITSWLGSPVIVKLIRS